MLTIKLDKELTNEDADKFSGEWADDSMYDTLVEEDADVYKPNGEPLLIFRKNIIPIDICRQAWANIRDASQMTNARGIAGGKLKESEMAKYHAIQTGDYTMQQVRARDGKLSNRTRANPVNSGVIGYMDKAGAFPYCRTTAYNLKNPEKFEQALPFIRKVNDLFAELHPERYQKQHDMIKKTHPDFYIKDTAFTTVTVNRNFRTAIHKDVGDYEEGFGVMTAFTTNNFKGFNLVFPKYRVAVSMKTTDLALCDVHEWHGNTSAYSMDTGHEKAQGTYERVSCVLYYRRNMAECGSMQEELLKAQEREDEKLKELNG